MLFARKEMRSGFDFGLSQRFTNHISRYFTTNKANQIKTAEPLSIPGSYALVGEETSELTPEALTDLKRTIQLIIHRYHNETGRWLTQEQVAFAAIWQDSKHQAITLKKRFSPSNPSPSTLEHPDTNSPLRLSLLAQALQISQFSITNTLTASDQPCSCSRKLNIPLDEINLAELESIGREVKQDCEQTLVKRGVSLDNMQACWQLKLRYENSDDALVLKCMPQEMLREVFVTQHLQQYGATDDNQTIVIDELEIKIHLSETDLSPTPQYSAYTEQWLSQWQQTKENQKILWRKTNNPAIDDKFSWLYCDILEEIVTKLMTKPASQAMPNLFQTNHQKDVDEVVRRN